MKNLGLYDNDLATPRKQDVDNKQDKIDIEGILKGNGNGNVSAAETMQTGSVQIPVGIFKGTASGNIETATPGTDYMAPIPVTISDNGKFLRVVNGAWEAFSVSDANGRNF